MIVVYLYSLLFLFCSVSIQHEEMAVYAYSLKNYIDVYVYTAYLCGVCALHPIRAQNWRTWIITRSSGRLDQERKTGEQERISTSAAVGRKRGCKFTCNPLFLCVLWKSKTRSTISVAGHIEVEKQGKLR